MRLSRQFIHVLLPETSSFDYTCVFSKPAGLNGGNVFDDDIRTANLLRMMGISSYGGIHFCPQIEFWKQLDPQNQCSKQYNRFGHVAFKRAQTGKSTYFKNPSPDVLIVHLSEENSLILDRFY
jgi:hypothetical protein